MNQLLIPTSKRLKTVSAENIIRIEASSNYCKIYFDNEYPLTVAKVLKWFEGRLPDDHFYRIHRTHIVNRHFISTVSCDKLVTLRNGDQLQVSKRKRGIVRQIAA